MGKYQRQEISGLDCVYSASGQQSPEAIAIFCHGFGAPGTDLVGLADDLVHASPDLDGKVRFIFPAAPLSLDPMMDARAWWPISASQFQLISERKGIGELAEFIPDELEDAHQKIKSVVEHFVREDQVPMERVFIGGFSQGAMLATDVFLRSGWKWGGLIAWSGTVINRTAWQAALKGIDGGQVVQSHGFLDPVLAFDGATALRDLLKTKHNVEFLSFQGYHSIPSQAVLAAAKLIANGLSKSL
jgi:phospholipase/carboxylesterase